VPYLVQAGSLTVVARSPSEALKIREIFLEDGTDDVVVADMEGFPVDLHQLQQLASDA